MMYFTESEASAVISNIASLLEKFGGCWITPDPEFMVQFFLTFKSVLGEHALRKLTATRNVATGQSDVGDLTNSFIVRTTDVQATSETALAFLQKHGLKAERINLATNMPELKACRKLTSGQIAAFKEAMAKCHYWKITLAADRKEQAKKQETQPFGMDHSVRGDLFRVSLRGRMDTITAPELLKVWEAEQTGHELRGIEDV